MSRYDLTDFEWRVIEPLLPNKPRGGLTTKIHAVVDAQGLPIRLGLTAGLAHHGQVADDLLNHLGPHMIVLADKAYDADRFR